MEHEGLSFSRKCGENLIQQQVGILKGSIRYNMSGSGKFWKTKECSNSVLISHDPTMMSCFPEFSTPPSPNFYSIYFKKLHLLHIHTQHFHHFIKKTYVNNVNFSSVLRFQ